jgi:4-hydroxythreonine-4-phosphate dehydrogenase
MSLLGITLGCPAGIGPEIIIKYFAERADSTPQAVVIGDSSVLQRCARELGITIDITAWQPGMPVPEYGLPVLSLSTLANGTLTWGRPNRDTAGAMVKYIHTAVALIHSGDLAAMITCPISKAAMRDAGYSYPGHTEMLVHLTGTAKYTMMMAGKSLKVTLATIHCPLATVSPALTREKILELIEITHSTLCIDFGISRPRIAVAGLNPHAGEEGLFGLEEQHIIAPAIADAQTQGIDATGPFPPDTVFFKAAGGAYDAVVCMYHDQGLIPFKLLHFRDGVNVTCGLPIVRTSVDHGTAYDIAGSGRADWASLAAAVDMAADIYAHRRQAASLPKVFP